MLQLPCKDCTEAVPCTTTSQQRPIIDAYNFGGLDNQTLCKALTQFPLFIAQLLFTHFASMITFVQWGMPILRWTLALPTGLWFKRLKYETVWQEKEMTNFLPGITTGSRFCFAVFPLSILPNFTVWLWPTSLGTVTHTNIGLPQWQWCNHGRYGYHDYTYHMHPQQLII